MMLTWFKLYEYFVIAANAVGVPAVVIIIILSYHVSMTQAQLDAHNLKTIELIDSSQKNHLALLAEARTRQEEQYERMVSFLRAICMNTASYDKNLMRECGKI